MVFEDVNRQFANIFGHGGRKQQGLAFRRQVTQDTADIGQETHVAHGVGFVQHQHLDSRQVDGAIADVIQQPAGASDHNFRAAPQSL